MAVIAWKAPAPGNRQRVGFASIVVTLHTMRAGWTAKAAGALAESQRHQGMFWETLKQAAQG